MEDVAAMGFSVNEIMDAMPGIISAAEASGSDLATTSGIVASALNAFQMEASDANKVADILAMTANISAAGVEDMGYALKYVAPVANALGISLEETSAAVGIMADSGIDGSSAGTALRASLLALNNPAKAQAEIMKDIGFSMQDSSGEAKSLSEIVSDLAKSTEGMTEAERVATVAKLVGTEASAGMIALMEAGAPKIDDFASKLENSGGSAKAAADIMKDNFKGALEEMGGAIETAQISIGNVLLPALQTAATFIGNMVDKFNALSPSMQKVITYGALITAALLLLAGPILILIGFIPAITGGFTAIAGVFGVTAGVLASTIGIVLGVIAAIAALAAIFYIAYNEVDWFREMVDSAWAWIKDATMKAFNFIKDIVIQVVGAIVSFAGEQLAKFSGLWDEHGEGIMTIVKNAFTFIKALIEVTMAAIKATFQVMWPLISNIVEVVWDTIKLIIGSAIDILVGVIDAGLHLLKGDWKGAWEAIKDIGKNIMGNIIDFFKGIDLRQIGVDIIKGLIRGMSGMISTVKSKVAEIANLIPSGVKSFLGIKSPSRVMMDLGNDTGLGFIKGIDQMVGGVAKVGERMAAQPVQRASQAQQSPTITNNTPINVTLNYSGGGREEDVYAMIDIIERELGARINFKNRTKGVR
jgi:TP901 family phage tail tape measure protein